ncbi:MAG: hypothetical protein AAFQ65_10820 [Myxococcota bacterium]
MLVSPAALTPGNYSLTVSTVMGQTSADVTLLQGEPGICDTSACAAAGGGLPGTSATTVLKLQSSTFDVCGLGHARRCQRPAERERSPLSFRHGKELASRTPVVAHELSFKPPGFGLSTFNLTPPGTTSSRPRRFQPRAARTTQKLCKMIRPHLRISIAGQQLRIDTWTPTLAVFGQR